MKKTVLSLAVLALGCGAAVAQSAITPEVLVKMQQADVQSAADKAVRNAMASTPLNTLATTVESMNPVDEDFTYRVPTKGITNQKQSGRCWLFTGMNMLRSKAMTKFGLPSLEMSEVYLFFYDQLEKSNLFLQSVIDTRQKPIDDRLVDWLFSNPVSDGGTFTGVADLVKKYGVVPREAMPETQSANATSQFNAQLKNVLREMGLRLRQMGEKGTSVKALEEKKVEMLGKIYHMLTLAYGVPPTEFTWSQRDKDGKVVSTDKYTPLSFYNKLWGYDLNNDYVLVMNDPSREYYKVYQIEYDRHTYDGHDWVYLNLPNEEVKPMLIASLKDSTAMYISCDENKFLNRQKGVMDLKNFDYESLLGVTMTMDKKERIITHASASSHAMTLIAVDIDKATSKPTKWMVENSWGKENGFKGNYIMTDEWFNEYMFRFVLNKKYVPESVAKLLKQKPIKLPAWDPMFAPEE